jgi:hypothetical protein
MLGLFKKMEAAGFISVFYFYLSLLQGLYMNAPFLEDIKMLKNKLKELPTQWDGKIRT